MRLLNPITIRFTKAQQDWLVAEAKRREHDRISLIIRELIDRAMQRSVKKGS